MGERTPLPPDYRAALVDVWEVGAGGECEHGYGVRDCPDDECPFNGHIRLALRSAYAGIDAASDLLWWELSGTYSLALVAAKTEERAIELANAAEPRRAPYMNLTLDEGPVTRPGAPRAEGVYAVFSE